MAIGQAIGRWGNFFNQEAYGRPTTLPWGLRIDPSIVSRPLTRRPTTEQRASIRHFCTNRCGILAF